jgi:hypothetical protein
MQIRIRDLFNPGSGMEKTGSRIWDKHYRAIYRAIVFRIRMIRTFLDIPDP